MIYSFYDERRKTLATQCADALGLKEIPQPLRYLAIQKSDLPLHVINETTANAASENSLLSMGVVYPYGPTLNFIARDGHTCILPNNEIIRDELKKCGYIVCKEGSSSPVFGSDLVKDPLSENYPSDNYRENELRKKATLPENLFKEVIALDQETLGASECEPHPLFPYDVFSEKLYKGEDYTHFQIFDVSSFLGYDDITTRKFLAFTDSYGNRPLSRPFSNVNSLESFLTYAKDNEILNDDIYFAPGSYYECFTASTKSKK